ncbi:MAG: AraC family transcriptional regulator [Alphaproteobacteria bacterium MedPE-SWcel]|nr:MAG: AraC family transcriptional regulator [Alphaproteobacteria bacterium MedPE-SWcel]
MDFFDALGLPAQTEIAWQDVAAAVSHASAPIIDAMIALPDPVVICGKLFRLDRYCATGVRLFLAETQDRSLTVGAEQTVTHDDRAYRLAVLHGLFQRAGFTSVIQNSDRLSWDDAPVVPMAETGQSTRLTDHLFRLMSGDPARAWRIDDAAAHLGLSSRSLQRYLLAEGGTFSVTLRQARTGIATTLLRQSDLTLAEIGFCCGYADQAHFQREFRRVTGQTPRHYRSTGGPIQALFRTAP